MSSSSQGERRSDYYARSIDAFTAKLVGGVSAQAAKHGSTYIQRLLRSDYGVFWKSFASSLSTDQNIPWDKVKLAQVQPEFVGIALSLIDGNEGARDALREFFAEVELPATAYETVVEVKEKICLAAIKAANDAPRDDRKATFAAERRLDETIKSEAEDVKSSLDDVMGEVRSLKDQVAESLSSPQSQLEKQLEEQVGTAFQEGQGQWREAAQAHLQKLEEILQVAPSPPPQAGGAPQQDEVAPEVVDGESVDGLLASLAEEDTEGAEVLGARYSDEGTMGIVRFLREKSDPRSVPTLDKAASIVALDGFFSEAERAHLEAFGIATEPQEQARQLVRAAGMAQIQGSDERFRDHLNRAKELAPSLPGVAIAEARASKSGEEMLAQVDGVEPESDRQRAILHVTRAQAWLLLGDARNSRKELTAAEKTGVNSLPVREMKGMVAWYEAKSEIGDGREPDRALLLGAAQEFTTIASKVASQQRHDEAAQIFARAAEAYGLAEDPHKAVEILESIDHPETLTNDSCRSLGEAAIVARRPDLVSKFVASPNGILASDLLWADAQLLREDSDPESRANAVEILTPMLEHADAEVRAQSAFALLGGSAANEDIEWNEAAAEIVRDRMPIAEASMRAQRLVLKDQIEKAETVLLPFGSDPKALRQLRDYAATREDWPKARDRSIQLFEFSHKPFDQLALADATHKAGDPVKAKEAFLAVARDREASEQLRGMGYSGAVEVAGQVRDYEEIRKIASEWYSQLSSDANGLWNLLFALARLAQHDRAYALVQDKKPDPDTEQRASLLAEILGRTAPKVEALRAISALSDRYDRSVEALEGLFLKVSLEAEQENGELPADLVDRIREAWATFPERFPDQQFMQVLKAPSTGRSSSSYSKRWGAVIVLGHQGSSRKYQSSAAAGAGHHRHLDWRSAGWLADGFPSKVLVLRISTP